MAKLGEFKLICYRIQEAMPADEGVYVCQAENQAGSISVGASLAVHGNFFFFLDSNFKQRNQSDSNLKTKIRFQSDDNVE